MEGGPQGGAGGEAAVEASREVRRHLIVNVLGRGHDGGHPGGEQAPDLPSRRAAVEEDQFQAQLMLEQRGDPCRMGHIRGAVGALQEQLRASRVAAVMEHGNTASSVLQRVDELLERDVVALEEFAVLRADRRGHDLAETTLLFREVSEIVHVVYAVVGEGEDDDDRPGRRAHGRTCLSEADADSQRRHRLLAFG